MTILEARNIRKEYYNNTNPSEEDCECGKCHTINTSPNQNHFVPGCVCKYCGTKLDTSGRKVKRFLTPIYGFVADRKNKETKRMKPFKTYASDTYYIGDRIAARKIPPAIIA